jgi:hypothetical protein
MMDADEKTPPEGPFAKNLQRIEAKIDALSKRQDAALTKAFEAHQLARTALWARASWGPYLVSALAFAMAFAARMRR